MTPHHPIESLGAERPVALVTGGASRVGAAVCRTFARSGFDLLLTSHQSRNRADAIVSELDALGAAGRNLNLDLSDLKTVDESARTLAESLPRLDVLIHNAAVYEPSPVESLTVSQSRRAMAVNAIAPAILSARLAPLLRASTLPASGAIVALCDIHAMGRPRPDHLAYSMSKAALVEMVRTLARDLAPRIRVIGVALGVVAFPESGAESEPSTQARYLSRVPLARSGTPEEAAETIRWLALEASYITGEIICLDGGRRLA